LLGAAMKKLKQISESGSNKLMLYLVIFVVVVFLMIYFAISWTRKPS
jgi:heme/copper-type cytochrome/quinol oxidase subunit 2